MAYVYRHIRLDKNEPFYIGISNDVKATKVSAVLNGRRNHTGGYTFKRISHEAEAI